MKPNLTRTSPTVADATSEVLGSLQGLVEDQIALSTERMRLQAVETITQTVFIAFTGLLALLTLFWASVGGAVGLSLVMPVWAALLTMAGVHLFFTVLAAFALRSTFR